MGPARDARRRPPADGVGRLYRLGVVRPVAAARRRALAARFTGRSADGGRKAPDDPADRSDPQGRFGSGAGLAVVGARQRVGAPAVRPGIVLSGSAGIRPVRSIEGVSPGATMTARFLVLAVAACFAGGAVAQDLSTTCQVASTYDLTVRPDALLFDRADVAPRAVRMHDGSLATDGQTVSLRPDEQDRVALFERNVRALVPRVKAIANDGVDLAARAVRDEASTAAPSAVASGELDRVLNARVADIKRRIAASQSTRDWQEDAMRAYAQEIVSDVAPILTQDVGGEAMQLAMNGDLQGAAALRDRVTSVSTGGQARVVARLEAALKPRIQALCPSIRQLVDLQSGLHDASGRPLLLSKSADDRRLTRV